MKRWFSWPRLILFATLLLLFADWYVRRISAARFEAPIRAALEDALGRKVRMGQVTFQLLPMPGFTIDNVYVADDPTVGPEFTAYIGTLRARPTFSALFGGPLGFASVDLEETSINLTRIDKVESGVRWNFSSLLRDASHPKSLAAFPAIHMIEGRVNFKFGDTKSIFYLLDTDVDLWPPARSNGPWTLSMRGQPARTDRPARGFGWFTARGEWRPGDGAITVDVKLEKSELGDMITLFEGHESGLHGHIQGDAHLAGPMTRVGIAGRVMLDDVHGWNQTPPGGNPLPLAVGGAIDALGQTIEIRATTGGQQPPIDLRYRVSDYLARPRWAVTAIFSKLPMPPVIELARNLGLNIPADLKFDGTAQGAVGYSMPQGVPRMDGAVRVTDSTLAVAETPPLKIPNADVQFAGSQITLAPAAIANDMNETATLQASYDTASQMFEASLASEGMSIASLRRQTSIAGVPLLGQATQGMWSGNLHYSSQLPAWSGAIQLKNADIPVEALAQPLHLIAADAAIDGAGVVIRHLSLTVGGIAAQGEYRYEAAAPRPHRFRINVARADGAALEKLLAPTLRHGNLLNYALGLISGTPGTVPEPAWMQTMGADGTVQVAALNLGGRSFTNLKTRVLWDGDEVRLSGLQGQGMDAAFAGLATVDLAQREPRYVISGKVAGLPWRAGAMEAEGTLSTSGTGLDLLRNMTAVGSFRGRDIDLTPLDTYETVDGCFEWSWDARNPKLKLTELTMTSGGATWMGSAEMQDGGQLVLRVSDGTKQIQASGALLRGDPLKPIAP